ncbi:hypothetical protein LNQ03_32920 [Klebsiella pneumoniae subsp. pneumoniae]|nr:hypothetical protein [Klebsiella pneumoniae subsp. pneumoniae]
MASGSAEGRSGLPLPGLPCEKSDAYFVLRRRGGGRLPGGQHLPEITGNACAAGGGAVRFRDRLPEKLRYLADAPQQDPEGNKTLVRFSRKTKQQYVASEKEGAKRPAGQLSLSTVKWTEAKK